MHPKTALLGVFRPLFGSVLEPDLPIFHTQTCFGIDQKRGRKRVEKRNFLQLNVFGSFWGSVLEPVYVIFLTQTGPKGTPKSDPKMGHFWDPQNDPFLDLF